MKKGKPMRIIRAKNKKYISNNNRWLKRSDQEILLWRDGKFEDVWGKV